MNERIRRIVAENLYGQVYSLEKKLDTYCEWILDSMCTNVSEDVREQWENER